MSRAGMKEPARLKLAGGGRHLGRGAGGTGMLGRGAGDARRELRSAGGAWLEVLS